MTGIDCGVQFEVIERILDKKMGGLWVTVYVPFIKLHHSSLDISVLICN